KCGVRFASCISFVVYVFSCFWILFDCSILHSDGRFAYFVGLLFCIATKALLM
ncbi:hypothetical protein COCCADRAFT_89390, partial [Bipolaris zeicola 26-R-13]